MTNTHWQPIETAPKNGVPIFITNLKWAGAMKAHWGEYPGGQVEDSEGNAVTMWGWVLDDFNRIMGASFLGWKSDIDHGNMPTHWCYPLFEEKADDTTQQTNQITWEQQAKKIGIAEFMGTPLTELSEHKQEVFWEYIRKKLKD